MPEKLNVVIEEECIAAWKPIRNTFRKKAQGPDWKQRKDYWTGIMIQVGSFRLIPPHKDNYDRGILKAVRLQKEKADILVIPRLMWKNYPIWVNVVTGNTDNGHEQDRLNPPVSADEQAQLFPDATMHPRFDHLKGGITVWQERHRDRGYVLTAQHKRCEFQHNEYTFEFCMGKGFTVEVHGWPADKTGRPLHPDEPPDSAQDDPARRQEFSSWKFPSPMDLNSVDRILIEQLKQPPGHGDGDNPPGMLP